MKAKFIITATSKLCMMYDFEEEKFFITQLDASFSIDLKEINDLSVKEGKLTQTGTELLSQAFLLGLTGCVNHGVAKGYWTKEERIKFITDQLMKSENPTFVK